MNEAYVKGFMAKCAEAGVDPEALVKRADFLSTLRALLSGETSVGEELAHYTGSLLGDIGEGATRTYVGPQATEKMRRGLMRVGATGGTDEAGIVSYGRKLLRALQRGGVHGMGSVPPVTGIKPAGKVLSGVSKLKGLRLR